MSELLIGRYRTFCESIFFTYC